MKIRGAIFDMDGTLLDSMTEWNAIGVRYLRERGITPEEDLTERIHKMTVAQSTAYMKERYGLPETAEQIACEIDELMNRLYRESIPLKPGVRGTLEMLKAAGVPMCVATVTGRKLAEAALGRCGVLPFFSRVFGAEDGPPKTEPGLYLAALEWLGTPKEETWVFEDARYAAKTAKAAGFPVAAVFDRTTADHEEELRALADRYIESFENFSL